MTRSLKKGPYINTKLLKTITEMNRSGNKRGVKTWARRSTISPEFVGRLPVVAPLDDLDEAALVRILQEPKNALVKQYARIFELENVKLEFEASALSTIARKATERKIGARGLRMILEEVMLDFMYEIPSRKDIRRCLVTDGVIQGLEPPILYDAEGQVIQDNPLELDKAA